MIKFQADGDTGAILGFGLSRGNIERLIAGDPILVRGEDINMPAIKHIWIFFGETEEEMEKMLRSEGLIGPQTKVTVDPRLRDPF